MKSQLHDRINRIINTSAFEQALDEAGLCVLDFQGDWANYPEFEALPEHYKKAILAGEAELASGAVAFV